MEDLTLVILREIREDLRDVKASGSKTVERLDTTVERLDTTMARLDSTMERLDCSVERCERRQVETEARLVSGIVSVVGAIHALRTTILEDRALGQKLADHEARLLALEGKRIA